MDPLTHTLVGANLAATRLGTKTRFAPAALVIGANLPDVDSILYFTGHSDLALGFRRGWTHGVLAIALLPLILTALLAAWGALRRGSSHQVHTGWLLLASSIGVLTHPFLDWLNNYGMRWLMPFRGTWSYGDSVFIMDPWLWLVLGGGWLAGRAPTRRLIALWLLFTLAVGWVVGQRSSSYLVVVAIVAILLLATLFWRPKRSLAAAALVVAFAYIAARLVIHEFTESAVRSAVEQATGARVVSLMVSPQPLDPTLWDFVAQTGNRYRYGRYAWREGGLQLAAESLPVASASPEWEAARRDPSVRGFMTWVRFPWYEVERRGDVTRVMIRDARYAVRRGGSGGFGGVVVELPRDWR